jgi:hypothetical protein
VDIITIITIIIVVVIIIKKTSEERNGKRRRVTSRQGYLERYHNDVSVKESRALQCRRTQVDNTLLAPVRWSGLLQRIDIAQQGLSCLELIHFHY